MLDPDLLDDDARRLWDSRPAWDLLQFACACRLELGEVPGPVAEALDGHLAPG